ncbi:hypothetical protein BASA50_009728 [Batrachochytrium salamandrivorans]|uniref:PLOD1-3-like GT domain-containing protein n=1 Tax=Batrachochytrium salamandrivorans TaxID=1357716 RepID=A0ABQ8F0Q0_9FUNG|nr:hypothetical protein BASA50_009728 [Batrachochytrium salamandrivorans]
MDQTPLHATFFALYTVVGFERDRLSKDKAEFKPQFFFLVIDMQIGTSHVRPRRATLLVAACVLASLMVSICLTLLTSFGPRDDAWYIKPQRFIKLEAPSSDHSKLAGRMQQQALLKASMMRMGHQSFPLQESRNSHSFSKTHPSTHQLLPQNKGCNADEHNSRTDTQCSNNVIEAARSPYQTPIRASRSLQGQAAPDMDKAGSTYYSTCASRDEACPVEWISYITTCTKGGNRLVDSVTATGIPMTVLGLGTVWRSRWGERIRALHDYLLKVPNDRIIVFSDADDVIIAPFATIESLMTDYRQLVNSRGGPTIFFPAETICYPDGDLWSNYTRAENIPNSHGKSPFTYLNAGVMIGPASHIRALIRLVYRDDCFDDQRAFTHAFLDPIVWWRQGNELHISSSRQDMRIKTEVHSLDSKPESKESTTSVFPPTDAQPLVGLDYWNTLSVALYGQEAKSLSYNARGLTVPSTGGSPLIIHQNGDKSDNKILEILARSFGMDYDHEAIAYATQNQQI